jgi:hypothetical protein
MTNNHLSSNAAAMAWRSSKREPPSNPPFGVIRKEHPCQECKTASSSSLEQEAA